MSKKKQPEQAETEQTEAKQASEEKTEQPAEAKTPAADWEAKYNDLNDRYLRMAAEYDNFRKRSQREREQAYTDAVSRAVTALLPTYDNLERALKAETADTEYKKGVEMTMTQLVESLKGINVAITARRLGIASCVLGCAGKNGIDAVRRKLDGEQVTHVFLPVDGDVRTNMKIVPQDGTGVTELNEPGAPVNAANQRAFSDLLAEKTVAGQYVVLTGSLPPECPPEYYRDLMLSLPERLFVLDVSGAALMAGLAARPFLVKPNRSELQAAMNRPLPTMADVHQAALELLEMGAQNVLVSLGSEGALWVSERGAMFTPAIPVRVQSTVGAGDAMVGGVMTGLEKTGDVRRALAYGAAAGCASVMTEGTQLIRPDDFAALLPQVQIQDV